MQNANTPASINIQPSDLAMIARALRKERDYCQRMKHECRSLQMDEDEINYWRQQENKCSDIINRISSEL